MSPRLRSACACALVALCLRARPAPALPQGAAATVEGTVEVVVADDFQNRRSTTILMLRTADGRRLKLGFDAPPAVPPRSGDFVRVTGALRGREITAIGVEVLRRVGRRAQAWTTGPKKILAVPMNYTDDTSQSFTPAQVQARMAEVAAYYDEVSYGLTSFSQVDVTPWVTTGDVGVTTFCSNVTGYLSNYEQLVKTNTGYDPANYDRIVFFLPFHNCYWAGIAYVGSEGAWINGLELAPVVEHELGHNWGLWHANSLNCGGVIWAPSGCTSTEYGDPFAAMGLAPLSHGHFNAGEKDILGWFPPGALTTVPKGTDADVTLQPVSYTHLTLPTILLV